VGRNVGHPFTLVRCQSLSYSKTCTNCACKTIKCHRYCHKTSLPQCHHYCKINCPKRKTCLRYENEQVVTRDANDAVNAAIDQTFSYMKHLISGLREDNQEDRVEQVIKRAKEKMDEELKKLIKWDNNEMYHTCMHNMFYLAI
jgi:hypothetical protein